MARDGETLVDEATYASAGARLDGELIFTPRPLATRGREPRSAAYRAQPRRAGLLIVPRRAAAAATPLAG